jgi:hypothetical protein
LVVALLTASPAAADEPGHPLDAAGLAARLHELAAAHPGLARVEQVSVSLSGRPVLGLVLAASGTEVETASGLLLVGGLDGRRLADSSALLATAERLLADADADAGDGEGEGEGGTLAEKLGGHVLVIVPRVNLDGTEALFGQSGPTREQAGNGYRFDADRDGRVAEDGPADLDGDGAILWMRVPDPEGEWVIDEHDPRAMRKARGARGERGTHRLLLEGRDSDGDGQENEDAGDGVLLDRNFPHGWKEAHAPAGLYPLSEPETRGLADWLLAHPGIAAVLVVGEDDTLVSLPSKARAPAPGWRGYSEAPQGVLGDDVDALAELKRRFESLTKDARHEVKSDGPADGSFLAWSYAQAGRWPLALKLWEPPKDLPKPKKGEGEGDADAKADDAADDDADGAGAAGEAADDDGAHDDGADDDEAAADDDAADEPAAETPAEDAAPRGGRGGRGGRARGAGGGGAGAGGGAGSGADDDDQSADKQDDAAAEDGKPTSDKDSPVPAAVLAWLDSERGGDGFLPWTAYEHDQLGGVEIGGLRPGTLINPPHDTAMDFAAKLAPFALEVLACLPRLALEQLEVERGADGLYSVSVALVNVGVLPTASELAANAKLRQPVRLRLELPDGATRLNGPPAPLVDRLAGGGGRQEFRWLVSGAPGQRLVLHATARGLGAVELGFDLP